ncbi:ADP-ribosylglycohydrolase [Prosthecobacter fusiformis]|uniref:ADP-ribosylglycohydrolase n=1 Tax=Prosthecobacter fusiformis TaxID=48464 RepID=A0A4R7S4R5_9BACT|nr:ADP-ribosylglycohydrolase family protein [Prosthecobacter fusiformis]TDU73430.1 ADP-ribosylglycohydrolase [Prosthecobacter fusiformis]
MISTTSRFQGALWGQFVADAAALGTHWIYDLEDLSKKFPKGIHGFEKPKTGHYHEGKQPGDQTHYGDTALLLLESVAACGGRFRENDFGMRFESYFTGPNCRSYKDHSTRETLEHLQKQPGNFQNGADDDQLATVSRLAPVVVSYQRDDFTLVADAIRRLTHVTQNHPTAVACATAHGMLLRTLLRGTPFREAFELTRKSREVSCDGSDYFEFAYMLREMDVITATGRFGQSCPLPQSFPSALHAAWRHQDSFEDAVLNTLRAGGDNAGRASMIGAWLGAAHGIEGIPSAWLEKLTAKERIAKAIEQLSSHLGE